MTHLQRMDCSLDSSAPIQNGHFAPIGQIAESVQAADATLDQGGHDLDPTHEEPTCEGVDTIESLCMHCGRNGTTRMLLTLIPFFKEVIIVSFRCPHCHHSNNSIQSAGEIQERGSRYMAKNLSTPADLNRQIIKSEHCTIRLNELEIEIPKGKGKMTTVEGLVQDTIQDLSLDQPVRKHTDPAVHDKIQELIDKLTSFLDYKFGPLTIELEDITGNSFIEALGGLSDPKWSKREFNRTAEQNQELGLAPREAKAQPSQPQGLTDDFEEENPDEVYSFPSTCTSCGQTLETRMKTLAIPHFKEIILMSTNCHSCGYKDNEVKSGGAISPEGTKLTLLVQDKEDLSRDILKSDTASLSLPEIDLHLNPGTLGGRFTTVEGLLTQIYEELDQKVFARGDSAPNQLCETPIEDGAEVITQSKSTMENFLAKLKQAIAVEFPYTLLLDDPLSNSYIQNISAPDPDPMLTKVQYLRTFEQNEELGLNDMKTENYA